MADPAQLLETHYLSAMSTIFYLIFLQMDLDVDDEILYNMEIKALPTVMIFQNRKGIGRVEGLKEPVVRDALNKL